ncbi:MAG TPA: hypothetical protein VF756_05755 [Thermoanaerobaculia bacterium]
MARPGTGYNPFPSSPDPWAVALSKGLIGSETEFLTWQANPVDPLPGATPGDPDVNAAWMARYGLSVLQPFPCGAELELTLWPRVLNIMWEHEWNAQTPGFDGNPTPREIKDAALSCDRAMICRAFSLIKAPGYVPENPNRIRDANLPAGLLEIPGRRRPGEPAWYATYRVPWGCNQYYFNEIVPDKPVLPARVDQTLRMLLAVRGLYNVGPGRAARIKELNDFVRSIPGVVLPARVDQTLKMLLAVRGLYNIGPGRAVRIKELNDFVRSVTRPAP